MPLFKKGSSGGSERTMKRKASIDQMLKAESKDKQKEAAEAAAAAKEAEDARAAATAAAEEAAAEAKAAEEAAAAAKAKAEQEAQNLQELLDMQTLDVAEARRKSIQIDKDKHRLEDELADLQADWQNVRRKSIAVHEEREAEDQLHLIPDEDDPAISQGKPRPADLNQKATPTPGEWLGGVFAGIGASFKDLLGNDRGAAPDIRVDIRPVLMTGGDGEWDIAVKISAVDKPAEGNSSVSKVMGGMFGGCISKRPAHIIR